jgi:hypothetical protein
MSKGVLKVTVPKPAPAQTQEDRHQGGRLNADGRCAVQASNAPSGLISIKVAGLGYA